MSTGDRHLPTFLAVAGAGVALGVLAATFTVAWPAPAASLFPHDPQPTLAGRPAEVIDIFVANLAVLVVPLLFAGSAGGRPGPWRVAGDLVTASIVVVNSAAVGAALALNGAGLLPYLPHLPVEGAALTLSGSTWIRQRSGRRPLIGACAGVVGLAVAAALIEVYATPHLSP
jgi:hypothetical protein